MNLIEAEQLLKYLAEVIKREGEDAKADGHLANEDLTRFERLGGNTSRLFNSGGLGGGVNPEAGRKAVAAIARLPEGGKLRQAAAGERAQLADRMSSHIAKLQEHIAKHQKIRERGNAAGGLGERELYQGRRS